MPATLLDRLPQLAPVQTSRMLTGVLGALHTLATVQAYT
jgi:hypothetical protein